MKKLKATFIPACIDPPSPPFGVNDPEALAEWIEYRADLDELEAELNKEHSGYDWREAMRAHKIEADQAIKALRTGAPMK